MPAPLQPGDILPARHLRPLAGDAPVRVGAHRRRAQVVVVTHPEPCEACASYLASFDSISDLFTAENADVLAVVTPAWQDRATSLSLPVAALVDDGIVGGRLSPDQTPVVAVADRFGQLFTRVDAGPDHRFPDHRQILSSLLDIAIRCPECGVPDVPSVTTLPEPGTRSGGMRLVQ
jgi:hypothetical protein